MKTLKKSLLTLVAIITLVVICCFGVSALNETGQCGDDVYWSYNEENQELVISGTGAMYDYIDTEFSDELSPFYNSYIKTVEIKNGVTSIGDYAFYWCSDMQRVTIPSSVTAIGDSAFFWCTNLQNVIIPDSVIDIGYSVFTYCYDLQSIIVDEKNPNYSSDSYGVLFNKNKTELIQYPIGNAQAEYTIPDSVTTINSYAFCDCDSLQSITIGGSVTAIGKYAFIYCTSLESITIPDSVTAIDDYAFTFCDALKSIMVDENNSCYSNDSYGVLFNKDKTKVLQYPIGNTGAEYAIPDSVTAIGKRAFDGCSELSNITIPDSVTTIEYGAFRHCDKLESVEIPDSVASIGEQVFTYCDALKNITVDENNPYYCNDDYGVLFDKNETNLIQYPIGNFRTEYTIPDSVTTIGDYAFCKCMKIRSVILPDSVTTIGNSAFKECYSLQNITIPDSVIIIDEYAFENCGDLQSATIGNSVTAIRKNIFENCCRLKSVTIGNSVTSIDDYAFYYCQSLQSVTIPDSVITIGNSAFENCQSLQSTRIGDKVTTIGDHAFDFCCYLESVTIGNGVTVIGDYAFEHCAFQSVTIPDSVTTIGDYAFSWCDLKSVEIGKGVIFIGKGAFEAHNLEKIYASDLESWLKIKFTDLCSNPMSQAEELYFDGKLVTDIVIPDGVTAIGDYAFAGCDSFKSITISDDVTTIGRFAFADCGNVESIIIGNNVTTIDEYAFGCYRLKNVYYKGTQEQWKNIAIGAYNDCLKFAKIHYNYHEHKYTSKITPATLTTDGKIVYKCSLCSDSYTETIAKVTSLTLSKTKYIYDGKNKTPKLTVKDTNGKTLVKNTDYKITVASKRAGIGRYTVKVTFMGNYSGSKSLYFYILPGKPATVKSASQGTASNKLTWSAVPGAVGYTLYYYSNSKKAYKKINTTTNTTYTVKGLLTGTKYTFKIVAYGETASGKVYDSETYALLKSATKTKTPELTKVTASSTKGKAYVYHTDVKGETGYTVYYSTSKTTGFKKYANFKADTTRCDVTKLTSGKTYYFKVRTYIKTDSGYVYSSWSAVKGVKVK